MCVSGVYLRLFTAAGEILSCFDYTLDVFHSVTYSPTRLQLNEKLAHFISLKKFSINIMTLYIALHALCSVC